MITEHGENRPEGLTAQLIRWCVANRLLVLMLSALLVVAGVWSAQRITIDAIPDLSDVQVVIRTDYPGQAPQLVQDQVTYPLTTAMLAVPEAKVVRGFSMFGTSFVYIIFEDGTDLYWARSRVLEQLSVQSGKLPQGVTPQLGPDATAVGWVFQYVLTTGPYCADHPQGLWHDAATDTWYDDPKAAPTDAELEHHRVFPPPVYAYVDPKTTERYALPMDAPADLREALERVTIRPGFETCPLTGGPLAEPDTDLSDLRGLQDWYLRNELTAVDGVSEVAAVGGFVKQYQVTVDPNRLLALGVPLSRVRQALQRSNVDVGGRLIERSETEYMVRGLGYLGRLTVEEIETARASDTPLEPLRTQRVVDDLRQVSLGATAEGVPIRLQDVGEVVVGPDIRRGVAEWNGRGEVVGGVVVMRFGENAQATIQRVRTRLDELEMGLPPGVAIEVAYDRSDLIERAVHTVSETLVEEILVVSLVILVFLMHARSAFVAACVLPAGVLMTITIMHALGINANIMSLGGIAISIGVMVDSSIVMVENAHKHFEREQHRRAAGESARSHATVIADAAAEVGPTLFFSLLIILVSFLPIFVLGEQSGRLFKPLAYTKSFAMASGAVLAVTLIPVVMVYFIRERTLPERWSTATQWLVGLGVVFGPAAALAFAPLPRLGDYRWALVIGWVIISGLILLPQRILNEDRNPISRLLRGVYHPAFAFCLRYRWLTLIVAGAMMLTTLIPLGRMGSEFMPPLAEGDLLYMPTTDPGISVAKATELLQQTDALIAQFPEVQAVFGKVGRADTATDPAPISMLETTITLHRDPDQWRTRPVERFYSGWPNWLAWAPSQVWSDERRITSDELIYGYELPAGVAGRTGVRVPGLNDALQIPGFANAWTMPIRTRIDMLSTGIRTPVGVKLMGEDLTELARLAEEVSAILRTDPRTRTHLASAFPDKAVGGNYFDIDIDRAAIARYGLTVGDVQDVIMTAIGGMNVTETVEGLERYPVNVRYPRELRDDVDRLRQTLVPTPRGAQVPLSLLASIDVHKGPPMIKSENARVTSWVYVDIKDIDVGTFVANAQAAVREGLVLPPGYTIKWSGQYEYMQSARQRLMVAVPLAAVAIVLLLYIATRSWLRVGIVLLAVPFSLIGAAWTVDLLGYNLSLAVWVGVIALAGLDAETGLVMLLYLDQSYERFKSEGRLRTADDLWHAVHDGAVQRIRPKTMTVMTTMIGLLPLLWASGAGADTMRRLAAPMIGGLATSFIAELLLYPVLFYSIKKRADHLK